MPFVSYARNFQDLLLWRALRDVAHGFYVDVGAGDPLEDSVTHAFYERGWRGLNLDGARALHAALAIARPADINLQVVAAASAATVTFYDIEGTLASTLDEAAARAASQAGATVVQRQLPGAALSALCERHAGAAIHFMNIGAGVDAAAVLAGLDLARHRPWIIVLPAAAAVAPERYRRAFDDGLSAYWVADEHAHLGAALRTPFAPGEHFVLRPDHPHAYPLAQWRERVAALQQEAAEADIRAQQARTWADARVLEREQTGQQREQALERQLAELTAHGRAERERADLAERALQDIRASTSWRVTGPLRSASFRVQALRARWRDLSWRARDRLARCRRAAGAWPKALVKRAMRAVTARPRLFFFLRHHIGRHPRLVHWLRVAVHRTQAPAAAPAAGAELDQLSAPARSVLADLQRSLQRGRPR